MVTTQGTFINGHLDILDLNGQSLITKQATQPKTQIDISELPGGVYIVRLSNDKGVWMGRFVKE